MEFYLAPMAGYTDLPFRRLCRKYGLKYASTALIDAGALAHGNRGNDAILHRGEDEPWLQVQLLGSVPTFIRQSMKALNECKWHYDALDFNMGCPVRKVIKRVAGAALMQQPVRALECLKIIRDMWDGPLTVKTRILREDDPETTIELAQQLAAVGIDGLTIHGRLARMVYSGPVQMHIISAVREAVKIPVTANGGIFSLADAEALAAGTGCERLMVARGAIGNPWLFRELTTGEVRQPTREELLEDMTEQLDGMVQEYGETEAMILGRKIVSSFLRGRGYPHELRAAVVKLSSWEDFTAFRAQLQVAPIDLNP